MGGSGGGGRGDFEPVGIKSPKSRKELLFQAIEQRDITLFEKILDSDIDVNKRGRHKFTPLYVATKAGVYKMVKALLEKGADPNALSFGTTPLMIAACAMYPDSKLIELLLESGADPKIKDYAGKTIFDRIEWAETAALLKSWDLRKKQEIQLLRKENVSNIISELNSDLRK